MFLQTELVYFFKGFRVNLLAFSIFVYDVEMEVVFVAVVLELYSTLFVALDVFLGQHFADAF